MWSSYGFVSGDNNFFIVKVNKISWNFRFHSFQKSVDVWDMYICLKYNCVGIDFAYWYNNLFSKRSFSSHIEFWFTLHSIIIYNIVNFNNFARELLWKYILDFENILNVIFSSLSEWLGFWVKRLGFLIIFELNKNTFTWLRWDRWKNSRNISLFAFISLFSFSCFWNGCSILVELKKNTLLESFIFAVDY